MASGILNVNKPPGMTSFAVVSQIRRLTGVKRVGHAGTLDPIADGVLPICLGKATRFVEYMVAAPKTYRTAIRLGASTETYDSEGAITATADPSHITNEAIEAELRRFEGEIQQIAPMYSALKHEGQPLYRYARANKEAPQKVRRVRIYSTKLVSYDEPVAIVDLRVGRGAYVRTLAHDLGQALGCYAHVEGLARTRSGPFRIETAVALDDLRVETESGIWLDRLYAPDFVLEDWSAALLGPEHTQEARHGRSLELPLLDNGTHFEPGETLCRAYSVEGAFVGVLRYAVGGIWKPEKVFG
jgi:tRNA pseudouridine55 synthase